MTSKWACASLQELAGAGQLCRACLTLWPVSPKLWRCLVSIAEGASSCVCTCPVPKGLTFVSLSASLCLQVLKEMKKAQNYYSQARTLAQSLYPVPVTEPFWMVRKHTCPCQSCCWAYGCTVE